MSPTSSSPLPSASPLPRSGEGAQIYDYLNVILRRRKVFGLVFAAIFCGVVIYTYAMKPIYEASATLHIKEEQSRGPLLGGMVFDAGASIDAELEILKSRAMAEKVVKRLHLDWRISDRSEGLKFKLLDFSSTDPNPSCRIEVTAPGLYRILDAEGRVVGNGQSGVLWQGKNMIVFLTGLSGRPGDSFRLRQLPLDDVAESLRRGFRAMEVGARTSIIKISYNSTDPLEAQELVNTLAEAYLDRAIAYKTEEASRTVNFIEEQLKGLRGELDGAEQNLEAFKSSSRLFSLSSEAEVAVQKLTETDKAQAELAFQKKQLEFALAAVREAARRGTPYTPSGLRDDPAATQLAQRLTELDVQKRVLLNEYRETHPTVRNIQTQIDELYKKIQAAYEASLENLKRQEQLIGRRQDKDEQRLRKLPRTERDLGRLTRVSTVNAGIYTFLLQKHEEARIAKAAAVSNINIVDSAIVPRTPVKPDKQKNLVLGFLIACLLGVGLAFFQEYLDDTIKDGEEAKRVVRLPLLAVIPHITSRSGDSDDDDRKRLSLITRHDPRSTAAEAFRTLRTSLHFSAINRDKRIMLLTSTFPSEGKSMICANLAGILAQTGLRVLVVDCDLRRSSLHEKFGVDKAPGLTEVLSRDVTFNETVHKDVLEGVDLLCAGTSPPNPAELLGSENMRQLLQNHREAYDHIIVDAPPVLAVTDAPVLTTMADITIVVMEAGRVPTKAALHMREMLDNVQAPVSGFIMNDKTGRGESYSYYGSSYYRYGYSGRRYGYGYGSGYGYGYYSDEETAARRHRRWWQAWLPWGKKRRGKSGGRRAKS